MKQSTTLKKVTYFGYIFLYAPILYLVIYSFNSSKLVTVWGGWSFKWYLSLFKDQSIINALYNSLLVAFSSASLATLIGFFAAFSLVKYSKGRFHSSISYLSIAPLVTPDIILGISMLLLFVFIENELGLIHGRGIATIIIAHTTLTVSFVTVVIRSRLLSFDKSIEEAALDLGAQPFRVLIDIIIPNILPALTSAWLLAFTISLDDVVVASFVSGPGSTTLPMLIFSKVRLGVSPNINALATIMIILITLIVIYVNKLIAKEIDNS